MKKKPVIGIVGGIASGKSEVARLLAGLSGNLFKADDFVHGFLASPNTRDKIVAAFGNMVCDKTGSISRQKLGEIVFNNSEKLKVLEEIIHPEVRLEALKQIEKTAESANLFFTVLDIPLLLEKDWRNLCDVLVFVDCEEKVRKERALQRGMTEEMWNIREKAQMPLTQKALLCQYKVINSNSLQDTLLQVTDLKKELNLP